jgi:hypothetical protein
MSDVLAEWFYPDAVKYSEALSEHGEWQRPRDNGHAAGTGKCASLELVLQTKELRASGPISRILSSRLRVTSASKLRCRA